MVYLTVHRGMIVAWIDSMARRRQRAREMELIEGIASVFVLALFYWAYQIWKNPEQRWGFAISIVVILALILLLIFVYQKIRKQFSERLVKRVESLGLREEIQNFIRRFRTEKGKNAFVHHDYYFDPDRIGYFVKYLNSKGLKVESDAFKALLVRFIDEIEYKLTTESTRSAPQAFDVLSGSDFEQLLARLFGKMGYSVQVIGKVGDQGGDLIANKNGKRFLIQAKRYVGSVGNEAVQQAVAAKNHYECTSAAVVTTGTFTRGARELAKTNNVQLVDRNELQENLLKHLQESWR
ncbi:MAG TPA: restriction endonuclease [Candidatus Methylomirabilis sp.]|nr:restriction endonuclease [Candidatus Methylomirabilis sp.]